jgi:hypothetical protein
VAEEFATSAIDEAMRDWTTAAATDAVGGARFGVVAVEDALEGERRTAER